ncbi:MAG: DNA polymerase III subunit delta, partial [Candidatus Poribacteria bacterium]|nr:DNA polymerase III subunit delta [Candidatus Poribacteria bacterium]
QTSIPNIVKEIQGGKVYPVYLLCGEEGFLIESTLKQMLDSLLEPSTRDFNLTFLDGMEVSARDILSAAEVYPVASDWRVVVVSESTVFKTQKGAAPLDVIRNAADAAAEENPRKTISLMVKVLSVSPQEIVDQSGDFGNALNTLIEETREDLSPEDLEFLNRLPQIAAQIEDLQHISEMTDDTELLIDWLGGTLPQTSVLIFTFKGNVDGRSRLVKSINRVGRYVSFATLEVGQSVQHDKVFQSVSRKLEAFGKKISPSAFNVLQKRTGNDMYLISGALEKIIAFVGEKTWIDERDIQVLVTQSSHEDIFALTDALGKRSIVQALYSLHSVLDGGEPPIKVNALIARQIRLMLQAKLLVDKGELKSTAGRMNYQSFVDTVFKPLGVKMAHLLPDSAQINLLKQNPYAAYKMIQAIPHFSTEELIQGLEKTLDADIQLKSSQLDEACILEQLVYELCDKPDARRPARRLG